MLVVLCSYFNREEGVVDSLRSVLNAIPSDAVLVVIDDASTDDTKKLIESVIENDLRAIPLFESENRGFTKALNYGISYISRNLPVTFLAIHGSGDLCFPEKFIRQIEYLKKHENVAAVGCGHRLISNKGELIRDINEGMKITHAKQLINTVPFTHGTVMYRFKSYLLAGGYDSNFDFCQDWHLYARLIDFGELHCIKEVLYRKKVFGDGASVLPAKRVVQMMFRDAVMKSLNNDSGDILYFINNPCERDVYLYNSERKGRYFIELLKSLSFGQFEHARDWCSELEKVASMRRVTRYLISPIVYLLTTFPAVAVIYRFLYRTFSRF